MSDAPQITYANEVARKGIHLSSLLIPIIYCHVTRTTGLSILIPMTVVAVGLDVLMHYNGTVRTLMLRVFGSLMRAHELREDRFLLNGASYVLIAATLCVALFPKLVGVTAFTILIVSDTVAALIGRRYGRRPFLDKSIAGTVAFVVSAWCCIAVYAAVFDLPWTYLAAGAVASVVGGVVEAASIRLRLDDNISIPMSIALVLCALGALLVFVGPPFLEALS